MLYSLNGSYPTLLPNRVRLSNGFTRTDRSTFTAEEIADAGYVEVDNPPEVIYPNHLEWNGINWVVRAPDDTEIANKWNEIKKECQRILTESDYKVIKAFELGIPLAQTWIDYRQAIRDIYNNVNSIDPWNVVWPEVPTNQE